MIKPFTVKLHSFVDLITNSSSTVYVHAHEGTVKHITNLLESMLTMTGSTKSVDELFKVSLSPSADSVESIAEHISSVMEEDTHYYGHPADRNIRRKELLAELNEIAPQEITLEDLAALEASLDAVSYSLQTPTMMAYFESRGIKSDALFDLFQDKLDRFSNEVAITPLDPEDEHAIKVAKLLTGVVRAYELEAVYDG